MRPARINRRTSLAPSFVAQLVLGACLGVGAFVVVGCSPLDIIRGQSPEKSENPLEAAQTRLIGDIAVPYGLQPLTVETVGLVTGLPGTGSDPPPSPERAKLLAEMQKRGVHNPNQILASPNTALVLVRGFIRPGSAKGDPIDLEVRITNRSEASSLRGGWLMETELREFAYLGGAMHSGHVMAMAEGPILVDPGANPEDDKVAASRGRILGGGRVLKEMPMALVLKPGHQRVNNSMMIGRAIEKRFHNYERGLQQGMANPKTNEYIELTVHPRYKHNIPRYLKVVRSIALVESTTQRADRLKLLEQQLLDPITSARAAMRLEAVGSEAVEVLKKGLTYEDKEVRFFAAEALAYLGEEDAAEPLAEAARNEPAFRVFALTALAALDDSYDELRDLLDLPSVETRYGAFRSLWTMDRYDPFIKGEALSGQFSYHLLDTAGPPLVHATKNRRPELVVFGKNQPLLTPLVIDAGPKIMVHSNGGEQITVSRLAANEPEQQRVVSSQLDDVIRAIVDLGGTYPDVVQFLQTADSKKVLPGRFEMDALPEAGRSYKRGKVKSDDSVDDSAPTVDASTDWEDEPADQDGEDEKPAGMRRIFGKLNPFSTAD